MIAIVHRCSCRDEFKAIVPEFMTKAIGFKAGVEFGSLSGQFYTDKNNQIMFKTGIKMKTKTRIVMLATAIGLMAGTNALAQWDPSTAGTSTDIYRSGAIGVGTTSAPDATVDIWNPDKYTRGLRISRDGTVECFPNCTERPYMYVRNRYMSGFYWEDIFSIDQHGEVGIGVKDAEADLHIFKPTTQTQSGLVDNYLMLVESSNLDYPLMGINNQGITHIGKPYNDATVNSATRAQFEIWGTDENALDMNTHYLASFRNWAGSGRVLRVKGGWHNSGNNIPVFQVEANGDYDENVLFRVMASGKVAVGNLNMNIPSGYKLYVDEGILTEQVKVAVMNGSEWSDFVFADDYKLRTLAEVEEFIAENKHLPDVPSADQMVENGLNVAEMDALLLQKIEELTLYVIDMEKRLATLDSKTQDDETEIAE